VLYVYFEQFGFVRLCLVYDKREVDNISAAVKGRLNQLIDEVEQELHRRFTGGRSDRSASEKE
jgi:hypothetical protein